MAVSLKEQQILAAAQVLFLRRGYEGATTDAVVERAGVSKETLYRYYPTKDDLLTAVIRDMGARRHAVAGAVVLPERASPRVLGSLLKQLIETALAQTMRPEYLNLLRFVVGESGRRPHIAVLLRDALTGGGSLRRLLSEAQKQGLVRRDVKIDIAAQMLGGAVLVAIFQQGLLAGARAPRRLTVDVDEVVRVVLRGVAT